MPITKAATITRGKAARLLIDEAEEGRRARAEDCTVVRAVERGGANPNVDAPVRLLATVKSAESSNTYEVVIDLAINGRGRAECSCPDFAKRGLLCKHAVAVASRYCDSKREMLRWL